MRREFLVVYDYGVGGVWGYLNAESPEQIAGRYPELTVVDVRPAWLEDEEERRIREFMSVDIDDSSNEFLATLRKGRPTGE
jgi:hypothetical protein